MALPDNAEVVGDALVFWELAHPSTLANEEGLYEYACFTACTNGLRPMGRPVVVELPIPELSAGEAATWGGRTITVDDAARFRGDGMVLAEIRLPVASMVGGVPPAGVFGLFGAAHRGVQPEA